MTEPATVEAADGDNRVAPADATTPAREALRAHNEASGARTIVVDDDATGSQAVRHVEIVTEVSPVDIAAAIAPHASTSFVLTNSRSLPAAVAARRNVDVARIALEWSRRSGVPLSIVSRSDSTLRGHLIPEADAARRRAACAHGPPFRHRAAGARVLRGRPSHGRRCALRASATACECPPTREIWGLHAPRARPRAGGGRLSHRPYERAGRAPARRLLDR